MWESVRFQTLLTLELLTKIISLFINYQNQPWTQFSVWPQTYENILFFRSAFNLSDRQVLTLSRILTNTGSYINCIITTWSANACPFSDSILRFRKRVKLYCEELIDINAGPLIVHCRSQLLLITRYMNRRGFQLWPLTS